MLSDQQLQCAFTLKRFDKPNGERILVYSVPNPFSEQIKYSRYRNNINDIASRISMTGEKSASMFGLVFFSLDRCTKLH